MSRLAVVVLALLFTAVLAQPASAITSDAFERRTVIRINEHREPNVRYGPCLDLLAERWARRLKREGRLYHRNQHYVLRRCGLRYAGEVIARGTDTPWQTVRAWLNSPSHRTVLKDPVYRRIGVGAVKVSGGWLVVANFGRH